MNLLQSLKLLINDILLLILWFPVRIIIQHIPLRLVYPLATMIAFCFYVIAGNTRRMTYKELNRCLGSRYTGKDIKRITRRSFEIYLKMHFEIVLLGKLTKEMVEQMVSVENIEHLDRTLNKGKGAIMLIFHFGSFLMIPPALGFMGYRINQISGPPVLILKHHSLIHRVKAKEYSNLPATFLRSDRSLMSAIKAIKKNEIVVIDLDGREGGSWLLTRFFDQRAYFSPGPIKMAMITGAPILPAFIVRQRNNTHRLIIERPIEFEYAENKEESISANIQSLVRIFEQYIKRYPCHYGMILQVISDRANKGFNKPLFSKETTEC